MWLNIEIDRVKELRNNHTRRTSESIEIDKKQLLQLIKNLQTIADEMDYLEQTT